jgi:co-chaperonin GroES (HSP10)
MEVQGKAVLILPDDNPEKTKSGIINPVMRAKPDTGTVIDHGPGCEVVYKGAKVQYQRKGASIIHLEGFAVEHHFIIEDQIVFVYG